MNERIRYKAEAGIYHEYEVHYEMTDWGLVEFSVWPISQWFGSDNTTGYCYYKKHESGDVHEFDPETCICLFEGSYFWRGVWEGRISYGGGEYWSEDLREMSTLFSSKIELQCKAFVKTVDKHAE